jgi:hypothetical protein
LLQAEAMAQQADRITEMAKAQAHLGANMADCKRKAYEVHAMRDSLRKQVKTGFSEFSSLLATSASEVRGASGGVCVCRWPF